MKRSLMLILVLLVTGCSSGSGGYRSVSEIKKSGVLNVYVSPAGKPYAYTADGILTGDEVALMEALAKELGVTPVFQSVLISDIYAAIQDGTADIGVGMIIDTSSARSVVGFTKPTGTMSVFAIAPRGELPNTAGALSGKTIGMVGGSAAEHALMLSQARPEATAVYADIQAAIAGLMNGECYAVVCSEQEADDAVTEHAGVLTAECVTNISQVRFAAMVARGNNGLASAANGVIDRTE